jgi:hypothetical protein
MTRRDRIETALSDMQTIALAGCGVGRCLESSGPRLPRVCVSCEALLTKIAVSTLVSLLPNGAAR